MPCRVCKAIDHFELTCPCPNPFSSASRERVLREIMARNPDYTYAEALKKVEKYGPQASANPSTGEDVEERQKEKEPAVELVGQDLVETSRQLHVSSCNKLFPSRRRSVAKAETGLHIRAGHHEDITANATDTAQQRRPAYLDHRIKVAEVLQPRTIAMADSDDARLLYPASALKHFRNREEKRETDRVSEAGDYREDEVVDPAVGNRVSAEMEALDEEMAEETRGRVVNRSEG